MPTLPTGAVTLLFTDIEASTAKWESHPAEMSEALRTHNEVLRATIEGARGIVVKDKGDGFFAAFEHPVDGVDAAVTCQRSLQTVEWPAGLGELKVRMALHTGPVEVSADDYHGPTVNRVARLEGLAHGGQVLVSDATRAMTEDHLAEGISFTDLGLHRLRGLDRAERVHQLIGEGLPSDFPPLPTSAAAGVPLPEFPTTFVGRDDEISAISGLLRDNRLVTLLGPGGIGKTRLAVEAARSAGSSFPGGVVFVDLAPATEDDVGAAIADGAGAHLEGRASVASVVAARAKEPTLMVLDNFEHVQATAPIVADVISEARALSVLATSRSPIHIRGERVYRVAPLAAQSNGTMAPAVRLFYDRAESFGAAIDESGPDRRSVEEICARVDGLPLAIELVAARTRLLGVRELAERLSRSLDTIGGGAADLPERQRTIRATIDWSLRSLTSSQQRLFDALSVYPAGASLEFVEVVYDGDDVFEDLAALVDSSLISAATGLPGGTRYRQLVPMREYAASRLADEGRTDVVMGKVVDAYRERAAALERRLSVGPDAERELEIDHANLLAAMRWSLDGGRAEDMADALSDIWVYWFNGDKAAPAIEWVSQADRLVDSPRLDWLVGFFAFQSGDYETSTRRMMAAAEAFEASGERDWLARAWIFAGVLAEDLDEGKEMLTAAVDYFTEQGLDVNRYVALIFLSANSVQRGEQELALAQRRELLARAQQADYSILIAWARWNLALSLFATGDIDETARQNELCLRQMADDHYQEGVASSAAIAALVAIARGDHERGLRLVGGTEAIWDNLEVITWPELARLQEEQIDQLRADIGDAAVDALIEEGKRLSFDGVVDLASDPTV